MSTTFSTTISSTSKPTLPFKTPSSSCSISLATSRRATCGKVNISCASSLEGQRIGEKTKEIVLERPDKFGKFGEFGGKYVPEIVIKALSDLESAFHSIATHPSFQEELDLTLREFGGRPTPLYFAERLSERYKWSTGNGPQVYFKREDLNHTGTYKMSNAIAQTLLAKRLGKTCVMTETSAGHQGVAVAAACARLGLKCVVYMGAKDMDMQRFNVSKMHLLGAEVRRVESGTASLKDAAADAIRSWVPNMDTTYYLVGHVLGPHPIPSMVRDLSTVVGRETRRQAMERWGGRPDVVVACVGLGSNAMGVFHEFVGEADVRLVGVEAAGLGLRSGRHAASLSGGSPGVFSGTLSYLMQDHDGQISECHSIASGMVHPGVGPELSYLKDIGRVEFQSVSDRQALEAFSRISKLEGIIPALETSHALAYLEELCPTLPDGAKVVVNLSGTGDIETTLETYLSHNQASEDY